MAAFLAAAVVLTWPWAADLWTMTAAPSDHAQFTWNFYWVDHQLVTLGNPWRTDDLFAPLGTNLGFSTVVLLPALIAAPVLAVAGAAVAFNVSLLLWLAAAGYVGYRLALALGAERWAAIIAGLAYMSSPTVLYRATSGTLNILSAAVFVPLALLAARRLVRRHDLPSALLLGGVLGAAALTDQTAALFALGALAGYALLVTLRDPAWRRPRRAALVLAALATAAILGAAPVVTTLQDGILAGGTPQAVSARSARILSADAAQLVLPSPESRFLGGPYSRVARHLGDLDDPNSGGFGVKSLGIGLIALAVVGAVRHRRRRLVRWMTVALLLVLVLSLGPALRLFGHSYVPLAMSDAGVRVSALMPYRWLLALPVLGELRAPERLLVLAALLLAALAALGASDLLTSPRLGVRLLAPALGVLAVAEGTTRLAGAFPSRDPHLTAAMRADPSAVVVDVPMGLASGIDLVGQVRPVTYAMVRAAEHGHPIMSGYEGRVTPGLLDNAAARPLANALLQLQGGNLLQPRAPRPIRLAEVRRDVRDSHVGWAVVWPDADRHVVAFLRRVGFTPRAARPFRPEQGRSGEVLLLRAPQD